MTQPHARTRAYSFTMSALMDGMLGLVQTAMPLLAIRLGATPWFLGMLGWTAQTARVPFTIFSGTLSDKIGRTRIIIPAAGIALIACMGFAFAQNNLQLLLFNILLMSSIGAFFPTLQAFIGDHSPRGQLRKNLSAFNMGWTIGGSVCALVAGYLLVALRMLPFMLGAMFALGVIVVIVLWNRVPIANSHEQSNSISISEGPGSLLFISRIGHFLGFFGIAIVRLQFPKLGHELNMSEGTIGLLVGTALAGQAVGILLANAGPWWQGKLWPQLLAQGMMVSTGLIVFTAQSPIFFALGFLVQGSAQGIAYTGALYYGMQARVRMGKNTGIHEMLVAVGHISGSFMGGAAAQFIGLRAPYVLFAAIALFAVTTSLVYSRRPAEEAVISK